MSEGVNTNSYNDNELFVYSYIGSKNQQKYSIAKYTPNFDGSMIEDTLQPFFTVDMKNASLIMKNYFYLSVVLLSFLANNLRSAG